MKEEGRGERRKHRTLKQEMLYSVQGIPRSDDICVWSYPGKLEANFQTGIPHLPPTTLPPLPSLLPPPPLVPRGDESKSFQTSSQAYRLPSSPSIRWEAAVSGLEFTGNNIVARRWPRNEWGWSYTEWFSRSKDEEDRKNWERKVFLQRMQIQIYFVVSWFITSINIEKRIINGSYIHGHESNI